MLTMPNMTEFSIQANSAGGNFYAEEETEFNCFQCYRKTIGQVYGSSDGRSFCSEICLEKYLQFMTVFFP